MAQNIPIAPRIKQTFILGNTAICAGSPDELNALIFIMTCGRYCLYDNLFHTPLYTSQPSMKRKRMTPKESRENVIVVDEDGRKSVSVSGHVRTERLLLEHKRLRTEEDVANAMVSMARST